MRYTPTSAQMSLTTGTTTYDTAAAFEIWSTTTNSQADIEAAPFSMMAHFATAEDFAFHFFVAAPLIYTIP